MNLLVCYRRCGELGKQTDGHLWFPKDMTYLEDLKDQKTMAGTYFLDAMFAWWYWEDCKYTKY